MLTHFWASMSVDLLGDFASKSLPLTDKRSVADSCPVLVIPIKLVWGLRLKWSKKAAIAATLCLTVLVMIITVIRIATIVHEDKIDPVWGVYWHIIAAEVGVIMAACMSFRVFFVARNNKRGSPHSSRSRHWYHQSRDFFRRYLSSGRRRRPQGAVDRSTDDSSMLCDKCHRGRSGWQGQDLPSIPRAHMTGMRTLINEQGRTVCASPVLRSIAEAEDKVQPQQKPGAVDPYIIQIRRDMSCTRESVHGDDQAATQDSWDDSHAGNGMV